LVAADAADDADDAADDDDDNGRLSSPKRANLVPVFLEEALLLLAVLPVENLILEKVRSGASGQTFALPTKKKSVQTDEVSHLLPTYASFLKKGLKWAPVTVHSF